MTPELFAVLLVAALALLALAFFLDNAAFGVASASLFIILAALTFFDGVSFETGKTVSDFSSENASVQGNVTLTNSTGSATETVTRENALPDWVNTPLSLLFFLFGLYLVFAVAVGDWD